MAALFTPRGQAKAAVEAELATLQSAHRELDQELTTLQGATTKLLEVKAALETDCSSMAKAPGLPACLSLSRFVCPLSLRLHTPVNVLFTCCSRAHFGIPPPLHPPIPAQTNPPTQPTHPTPPHPPIPAQPSPVHPPQPFPSHPNRKKGKRKKRKKGKRKKRKKGKRKKEKGEEKKFLRRGFLFRSTFIKTRKPLKRFRVYPIFRACGAPP